MKKNMLALYALILGLCFGCVGTGRNNGQSYDVLVLGDLHYDAMAFRQNVDSLTTNRKKELARNLMRWGKPMPDMLEEAGEAARHTAFGIQLGDISQGDCGAGELQRKAFASVLELIGRLAPAENAGWRLPAVKGNHDIRGDGAPEAYNAVMLPYLERQFGQTCPVPGRANFSMVHGPDLFVFFDSIDAGEKDLLFVKKTLEAHPNARHVFFLTHLPVIPASRGTSPFWLAFGDNAALRRQLLDMLAARHAIVLAAHVHVTTLLSYRSAKGTITQFTSFSMPESWTNAPAFSANDALPELSKAIQTAGTKNHEALEDFENSICAFTAFSPAASFNILHVTKDQVVIDRHAASGTQIQTIPLK